MPVPPRFDGLSVIELDITMSSTSWSLLRDYLSELDLLEKQDWISFRGNMHLLHDLAMSWRDKVKERIVAGQANAVMLHLSTQLERIKAAATTLKYCHGKDFKDEHWSALLQGKLGLRKEVRLESLTVGHFVTTLDKVLEPAFLGFVKELQAQAQGEVLVRDALQELTVWSQTAELSLVEYKEQGRKSMLVKDWGRMFLDLGDKQSLLSSLKESQFYRAFESIGKWSNKAYAYPTLSEIQAQVTTLKCPILTSFFMRLIQYRGNGFILSLYSPGEVFQLRLSVFGAWMRISER